MSEDKPQLRWDWELNDWVEKYPGPALERHLEHSKQALATNFPNLTPALSTPESVLEKFYEHSQRMIGKYRELRMSL